ncbi:MAG: ABC transporter permease, partial [Dehalococcoidia bacterium]|nr:ABC transporter permease [Dehalococcoidia bacterium]
LVPEYLTRPIVVEAIRISAVTTTLTILITVTLGTPVAYLLARWDFPGKDALDTLLDLPVVLPPAVAGVALLVTFGRRGVFGPLLTSVGVEIAFTTAAVVLAQTFVAAPFYIRSARAGFVQVDRSLEGTARTLGVGPLAVFFRVTAPLAAPSLVGGVVLAWAKALGEFGATILFAGSVIGRTQTLPLAIYQALETDVNTALVIATILILVSFVVLVAFRRASGAVAPHA